MNQNNMLYLYVVPPLAFLLGIIIYKKFNGKEEVKDVRDSWSTVDEVRSSSEKGKESFFIGGVKKSKSNRSKTTHTKKMSRR
jgi:hypothetical protein